MSEFFRAKFPEEPPPGWIRSHIRDGITEVSSPLVMRDDEIYRLVSVRRRHGGMFDRERLPGRKILTKDLSKAVPGAFVVAKRQVVHGATCLVPSEMADAALASSYAQFLGTERCDIDFFARLAQHPAMTNLFYDASQGVVVEKLTLSVPEWLGYKVNLPPLPEQRAIAAVLDTIDDAIQKTEQIIAKLQQVKQGLLHDLLTRGIDDNGELRDPERHPEQFQDSPLGRIPKGWYVVPFGALCESSAFGPRFPADRYSATGGLATLRTTDISDDGGIDLTTMPRAAIPPSAFSSHLLRPFDLVISRSGTCGIAAVFPGHSLAVVPGAFLIRFRLSRVLSTAFFRRYFNSKIGRPRLERLAVGGVQKNIKGSDVLSLLVPSPSENEQDAIVRAIESVCDSEQRETEDLVKLRVLKAGLSDDLLTGRVRTTSLPGFSA